MDAATGRLSFVMKGLIWPFVFLVATAGTAGAQEPLSFKGFPLSGTRDQFAAKFTDFACHWNGGNSCVYAVEDACPTAPRESLASCVARNTYGGTRPARMAAHFRDGKLRYIEVDVVPDDFEGLAVAMAERFGPPSSSTTEPLRTRAGVEYTNARIIWKSPEGELRLTRYGATVDKGSVVLMTLPHLLESTEKMRDRARAAPKDL